MSTVADERAAPAPTGSLGAGAIVLMVVAAAAPLTVVGGAVPLGIALGDGAAFPATFVPCCAVLLLFAVGYAAMSRHVPQAGAFCTYVRHGLGGPAGHGTAPRTSPRHSGRPAPPCCWRSARPPASTRSPRSSPGCRAPPPSAPSR
ncbi:hypothetical protein [Streptomyces sp. enrichment culture]|uniref:hypothetical protein n=1 Tax=Streptomyces sp. enrichment culture TaxID=1795815 RepID=UPI003F569A20